MSEEIFSSKWTSDEFRLCRTFGGDFHPRAVDQWDHIDQCSVFTNDPKGRLPSEDHRLGFIYPSAEVQFRGNRSSRSSDGLFQVRRTLFFSRSHWTFDLSRNDRFLLTIGNYQKPILSLWSTDDYRKLCTWQDQSSSLSYLNCLAWNLRSSQEFSIGGSQSVLHFCTIHDDSQVYLRVLRGQISSLYTSTHKAGCDITSLAYLPSMLNVILCATNDGLITCWNTRLALCLHYWRVDSNEICWMRLTTNRLLTGSASGSLKLWNIESLLNNLGHVNTQQA